MTEGDRENIPAEEARGKESHELMQEPVVLKIGNGARRHGYAYIWTVTDNWQSIWNKQAGA